MRCTLPFVTAAARQGLCWTVCRRTVYWGRQEKLVPYLQSLGFTRPESENPADWMIDVCSGLETRVDPTTGAVDPKFTCPDDLYAEWSTKQAPQALDYNFAWTEGDPKAADATLTPLAPRCVHVTSLAPRCVRMRCLGMRRLGRQTRKHRAVAFSVRVLLRPG